MHTTTWRPPGQRGCRIRPLLGFHGFIQIGIGVGIGIGIDYFTTGHFLGFHGFMVSRFHGFIQIGIGVGIGIGIDCLTTNTRDGTARVFIHRFTQITQVFWGIARFLGTPGGIPDFHEVSCFSWFHPNRGRYRYRYRGRLFNHGTLSWVSWFQVSRFHGFIQIGIGVGIGIGIAIGIAIGIDFPDTWS